MFHGRACFASLAQNASFKFAFARFLKTRSSSIHVHSNLALVGDPGPCSGHFERALWKHATPKRTQLYIHGSSNPALLVSHIKPSNGPSGNSRLRRRCGVLPGRPTLLSRTRLGVSTGPVEEGSGVSKVSSQRSVLKGLLSVCSQSGWTCFPMNMLS